MKIIFVGLHNKPGLKPLDSSTVSGKIIDKIIGHFNGVQFEKKNLFPVDFLPEFLEREKYIAAFEVDHTAFYIALGKISFDGLKGITNNVEGFYHPSFANRQGKTYTAKYIDNIVKKIEYMLHLEARQRIRKTNL